MPRTTKNDAPLRAVLLLAGTLAAGCYHTDLRVTAADVLLSMVTLLIYTPHTLSVTCPAARP